MVCSKSDFDIVVRYGSRCDLLTQHFSGIAVLVNGHGHYVALLPCGKTCLGKLV